MERKQEAPTENVEVAERLLPRVNRDEGGCWIWTGAHTSAGYGAISVRGKVQCVHRVVAVHYLSLDEKSDLYVLHDCDEKSCCNPDHLRLGTHRDNMLDATVKGRMSKKLKPQDVIEIRRLRAEGHTQKDLATRYGVSRATIQQIERRETWRHLPDEAQGAATRSDSTLDSLAESA